MTFCIRRALAALLLLAAAPAHAARASAPVEGAPEPTTFDGWRARALEDAPLPRGVIALHRLRAFGPELDALEPLEQAFEAVATSRKALPENAALARLFMGRTRRTRGFANQGAEELARLGFLTKFQVVGAFDNEGRSGCSRAEPAESDLDPSRRFPGKERQVGWRPFEAVGADGFIDLAAAVRPLDEVSAYAATQLDIARDQRVTLRLGAAGASRLWVDGQLLVDDPTEHGAALDQRGVTVNLRKGSHRVMVKLCQSSGPMGFWLRAVGPKGEAPSNLEQRLPDPKATAPKGALQPELVVHPVELQLKQLEKRLATRKAGPLDAAEARQFAELAESLALTQLSEQKELKPAQLAVEAARALPDDRAVQALAARLESRDANDARRYLERAVAIDPTWLEGVRRLAQDDLSRGHPERARARLGAGSPQESVATQLLRARIDEELGDPARAAVRVTAIVRSHGRDVAAVRDAMWSARRAERADEALGHARVLASLRTDDLEARRTLSQLLADRGEFGPAIEALDVVVGLDPADLSTQLRRAELLAMNGRADEGLAAFDAAERLCADEPEVAERRGRTLLTLGRDAEAIKAFEVALALRPQNPKVQLQLEALRGKRSGWGEAFAADAQKLLAAHPANAAEDVEILSSTTAIRVAPNGTSSRYVQFIARANGDRGVEALRRYGIHFAPDRQDVVVLRARTWKADGSSTDAHTSMENAINEEWSRLYFDARVRTLGFPQLRPGDAVELAYRLEDIARDNLLSDYFGDLTFIESQWNADRVTYVVDMPAGRKLFSSTPRIAPASHTETALAEGGTRHSWVWNAVARLRPEPNMPGWGEAAASLHVSTYADWNAVGRFWWGLVRDQLVATETLKKTAAEIVKGIPESDTAARVRAVHDWVVTKTRYVGLEFGIHSFKPYAVERVLSRRFGDCKDKASLTHALLREAGVPTKLVLLRMQHLGDVGTEIASLSVFNHAISYVPSLDWWLDGTAEWHGAQEIPTADRNALVLVVDSSGESRIGHIPEAKATDSQMVGRSELQLTADGTARVTAEAEVSGMYAPPFREMYATEATRKTNFERDWAGTYPGLQLESLEVSDTSQLERPGSLKARFSAPRHADVTAGGLSISPFQKGAQYLSSWASLSSRRFPVQLGYPTQMRRSRLYRAPAGWKATELPPVVAKSTPFGSYRIGCTAEGEGWRCDCDVELATARVPVADYAAFRTFAGELDEAVSRRLVLSPPGGASAPAAKAGT